MDTYNVCGPPFGYFTLGALADVRVGSVSARNSALTRVDLPSTAQRAIPKSDESIS